MIHARTRPKEQKDERMAWWCEATYGMFIHWGVYALPAGTYTIELIPVSEGWAPVNLRNISFIPVN
jgi:alpha-L-fucosidase